MNIKNLKNNSQINIVQKAADACGVKVWLIGGALRDIALGSEPSDFDFILFGEMPGFIEHLSNLLQRSAIHIGADKKEVVRFVKDDMIYDFTPAKGATIEEDILHRDFTINTLAYQLDGDEVVDLRGSLGDIHDCIVRVVDQRAFDDDPLRLLRAFRFMAQLRCRIAPETLKLITEKSGLIANVATERVRDELFKIFAEEGSFSTIKLMADSGLLYDIFPELKASVGCIQNKYHHLDVMEHTLCAYENLEDIFSRLSHYFVTTHEPLSELLALGNTRALLKYSVLLHDVAKPMSRTVGSDGRVHFYGHCEQGEKVVAVINARLKLSVKDDTLSRAVIRRHLRIVQFMNKMDAVTRKSMLRYYHQFKEVGALVVVHNLADLIAARGIKRATENEVLKVIDLSETLLDTYFNDYLLRAQNPPLINGRDLIERFGLTPSPLFSNLLAAAYEKQMSGEISTVAESDAFVRRWLRQ